MMKKSDIEEAESEFQRGMRIMEAAFNRLRDEASARQVKPQITQCVAALAPMGGSQERCSMLVTCLNCAQCKTHCLCENPKPIHRVVEGIIRQP